jgi:hypothetical protein
VSALYYSRKLYAYNLTVYEATPPNKDFCFAWTVNNGQRENCEIEQRYFSGLKLRLRMLKKSLYFLTHSGQNSDQYIAVLFMFISQTFHFKIIEHKFLEKGHTHMEVDSMHSAIEYAQKHVLVVITRDWMNIFKMARSNRNRNTNADNYACRESKFDDFRNLKTLSAYLIQNRTRDSMNRKVQWLKIKRMRYEKDKSNIVIFSYDQNSEYR